MSDKNQSNQPFSLSDPVSERWASIEVSNTLNKKQEVELLCWILNGDKKNQGLPKGVIVSVKIKERGKPTLNIKYSEFLASSLVNPLPLQVYNTTDNRRLMFYRWNIIGERKPMVPQISPEGLPHYLDKEYVWNEKEHNIADTKEGFIMDGKELVFLTMTPKETFTLNFKILQITFG